MPVGAMAYTLTGNPRATLREAIREHLRIALGDSVEFRMVADGSVRVEPAALDQFVPVERQSVAADQVLRLLCLRGPHEALEDFDLQWEEMPREGLFLAARAHRPYRGRGSAWSMVLTDFFIGAHAAVRCMPLLTRDRRRSDAYFRGMEIVTPAD